MPAVKRKGKKAAEIYCDECDSYVRADLGRHKRSHAPPTMHCPWPDCGHPGFRQRSNLKTHVEKWHLALREHACPHEWMDAFGRIVKCPATFDDPAGLSRHRQKRHGYNPDQPDQPFKIFLRKPGELAADKYYYEVVVRERMAARLAQAGLPPVGWEELVYGRTSFKASKAYQKKTFACAPVARADSESFSLPSVASGSFASNNSFAPTDYSFDSPSSYQSGSFFPAASSSSQITLDNQEFMFNMGESSSSHLAQQPVDFGKEIKAESPAPSPSSAQRTPSATPPQATTFLDMLDATDMLFASQVPAQLQPEAQPQFFEAPLPDLAPKSEFALDGFSSDWATMNDTSLGFAPALDMSSGWAMGAEASALAMGLPAAPVQQDAVLNWDAFYKAAPQQAAAAASPEAPSSSEILDRFMAQYGM